MYVLIWFYFLWQ